MEGMDRVAKATDFAHFLEKARRHPAAKHTGEYLQTVKLTVAHRQSFQRHGNMDLLEIARLDARAASKVRGLGRRRRGARETCEPFFSVRNNGRVVDGAGCGDDHARSLVVP